MSTFRPSAPRRPVRLTAFASVALLVLAPAATAHETGAPHDGHGDGRTWLAGDHHVHSQFSVDWKPGSDLKAAPEPVIGGDFSNTIPTNARMGRKFGLSWMAATDHGGPNHSRVSRDLAYPEVLKARREVADLVLFFGLELEYARGGPFQHHRPHLTPGTGRPHRP